jgi:hypothetical protein
MATTVNETKVITLLDGSTVNARPLKLSLLREFMNTFTKIQDVADDNDKSLDLLLECVKIAFKQFSPDLAAKETKDLEDVLDIKIVYEIIEEASGIKVGEGLF